MIMQKNISTLYMDNTISEIKNKLKNKKIIGYSNLNKSGLETYLKLSNLTKPVLNKIAKKVNKKILVSKTNKKELLNLIIKEYKKSSSNKKIITDYVTLETINKEINKNIKKYEKIVEKVDDTPLEQKLLTELIFHNVQLLSRQKRNVDTYKGIFTQKPIKDIPDTPEKFYNDMELVVFSTYINAFIDEAEHRIFKFDDVIGINYKKLYVFYIPIGDKPEDGYRKEIKYESNPIPITPDMRDKRIEKEKIKPLNILVDDYIESHKDKGSGANRLFIGYQILIHKKPNSKITDNDIYQLKAFKPSNNRKYHELCCASTTNNKICIYETFLHITGKKSLRYMRKEHNTIMEELRNEGYDIEKSVKNGELLRSLELLTKKYNNKVMIVFYESSISLDNNKLSFNGDIPIIVECGKVIEDINNNDVMDFIGKPCFLYQKDVHVAPFIFNIDKNNNNKIKTKKTFKLTPEFIKNNNITDCDVYGYDLETYTDENDYAVPYCLCLYGENNGNIIEKSFYGLDCINEFINYINNISTPVNNQKSRPKNKVRDICLYGFNNSRFDNIFIYEKLYDLDPCTKFIFTKSAVKYIQYNNIKIFDICLQYNYKGLANTAKAFKLDSDKGVFPYKFVNHDNIYYNGFIPDIKYWNSIDDYNQYKINEGNTFNMEKYTIKYCMRDSEIVYKIAKIHLDNSIGEINGRLYNVSKCNTSASLSIKIFQQCFLNDVLYQSPDNIIKKERFAYKGGRTEVFKKSFKSDFNNFLYYYDINSSYPSSMTGDMPYKYINTIYYNDRLFNYDEIDDCFLYLCRYQYIGDDKHYIPNLLLRDSKTNNIISVKNSYDYSYHWGCEIKEAIQNGNIIYINEANTYEKKPIFKVFSEYFYNERLKIKATNPCKSLFFKNILNSLYGKFGQKPFTSTKLCKNSDDVYKICNNKNTILKSFNVVNDNIIIEYENENSDYSIGKLVRFSSYISAKSRCSLSAFMRDVSHENVYYCDTDSVFTSKKPSDCFIDQKILGKWKLECEPIYEACFIAPKVYNYKTIDEETCKKAKGVNSELVNYFDYFSLLDNGLSSIPVNSLMFFRSLENVKIKDQTRNIKCVYTKRIWFGNNSEAFDNIDDWITFKSGL